MAQLDAGIRLLDLRFGWDSAMQNLVFYHGRNFTSHRFLGFERHVLAVSLLSATATMEDVLAGLFKWLSIHPTETLLLSLKVGILI